jgi:hypothetical protein
MQAFISEDLEVMVPEDFKIDAKYYSYEDGVLSGSKWAFMNISSTDNVVTMKTDYNGTNMTATMNGTDGSMVASYMGMCFNQTYKTFDVEEQMWALYA